MRAHTPVLRTSVYSALRAQHGAHGVCNSQQYLAQVPLLTPAPSPASTHSPCPQFPLQPTSALCSPSEQLSHQDDEDQEEKGPQDEAEDPRQGEDARERI